MSERGFSIQHTMHATVTVATPYSHSNTFEIDLNSHKSADLVLKIRNIVPMGYVEICAIWFLWAVEAESDREGYKTSAFV